MASPRSFVFAPSLRPCHFAAPCRTQVHAHTPMQGLGLGFRVRLVPHLVRCTSPFPSQWPSCSRSAAAAHAMLLARRPAGHSLNSLKQWQSRTPHRPRVTQQRLQFPAAVCSIQRSYDAGAGHALGAVLKNGACPAAGAVEAAAAATKHGLANPLVAVHVGQSALMHWCIGGMKCNSRLSLRQEVVHLEAAAAPLR